MSGSRRTRGATPQCCFSRFWRRLPCSALCEGRRAIAAPGMGLRVADRAGDVHAPDRGASSPWAMRSRCCSHALDGSVKRRALATWPMIALGLSALLTLSPLRADASAGLARWSSRRRWKASRSSGRARDGCCAKACVCLSPGIPGGLVTVLVGLGGAGGGCGELLAPVARHHAVDVPAHRASPSQRLSPRVTISGPGSSSSRPDSSHSPRCAAASFWCGGWFAGTPNASRWRARVASRFSVFSTVPRAWLPKQQFRAAWEFVEQERRPGDQVVALDVAADVYLLRDWTSDWRFTRGLAMVAEAEQSAPRTWIVYTLPARLRAVDARAVRSTFRHRGMRWSGSSPATVGGGEIQILRHDSSHRTHD